MEVLNRTSTGSCGFSNTHSMELCGHREQIVVFEFGDTGFYEDAKHRRAIFPDLGCLTCA